MDNTFKHQETMILLRLMASSNTNTKHVLCNAVSCVQNMIHATTWQNTCFASSWRRPTWPKCPAISCYWLIDSATNMLIKIYLSVKKPHQQFSRHYNVTLKIWLEIAEILLVKSMDTLTQSQCWQPCVHTPWANQVMYVSQQYATG